MIDLYEVDLEEELLEPYEGRRWPRWLFLLIGLTLGLVAGLVYTWGLNPVQFYNTDPADLHPQHKETWLFLVAAAYRQDGDLDRALSRLAGLNDPHIVQTLTDITERNIQAGKPATRIRTLATLADALGARTEGMLIYLATPEPTLFFTPTPRPPTPTAPPVPTAADTPTATATPSPTPTATATPTALPTRRSTATRQPTATLPPPYILERRERICESDRDMPTIEIVVQTQEGAGVAGTEIWVTWTGGADRFITGLKPELGLGYSDFDVTPGVVYAVAVGDPTLTIVSNLRPERCPPGDSDSPLASWRLVVVATSSAFPPTPAGTPVTPTSATPTATRFASPTASVTPSRTSTPTRTLP